MLTEGELIRMTVNIAAFLPVAHETREQLRRVYDSHEELRKRAERAEARLERVRTTARNAQAAYEGTIAGRAMSAVARDIERNAGG